MAARIIDGKAVAAAVRERVRGRGRRLRSRGGPGADAGDGDRRRRPGLARSTSATSTGPARRSGCGSVHHGLAADDHARPSCWSWSRALGRDDEVDGILVQLPVPDADRPRRGGRARSTRARTSTACTPVNAGLLAHGTPRLRALHPGRGDGAAAPRGRRRWRGPRRSSSGARSWSACRSRGCCWRANATVTVCHSRTRDLAATCAARRRPRRGGRRAEAARRPTRSSPARW